MRKKSRHKVLQRSPTPFFRGSLAVLKHVSFMAGDVSIPPSVLAFENTGTSMKVLCTKRGTGYSITSTPGGRQ